MFLVSFARAIKLNYKKIKKNAFCFVGAVYVVLGYLNLSEFEGKIFPFLKSKVNFWGDCAVSKFLESLLILVIVFLACFVIAVIYFVSTLFCKKEVCRVKNHGSIYKIYGDLFSPKREKDEKGKLKLVNVVIPVNRYFDTLADDVVIKKDSVHGRWIRKMESKGMTIAQLDSEIGKSLSRLSPVSNVTTKYAGKQALYDVGTIAEVVDRDNIKYFLLGLTDFDDELHTKDISMEEYLINIQRMIERIIKVGNGCPVYIPLIGTGMSGVIEDEQSALELLVEVLKLNKERLNCDVYVVVYKNDKDKVRIG